MDFIIRPMSQDDCEQLEAFSDRWIGKDYLKRDEIKAMLVDNEKYCFVAVDKNDQERIVAMRITLGASSWPKFIKKGMDDVTSKNMAYFKSLFVAGDWQQKGLGRLLSDKSLRSLKEDGHDFCVCHCWLESPGNSSQIYLQKMGFSEVNRIERFWYDEDYECIRCGEAQRCICSASVMLKKL